MKPQQKRFFANPAIVAFAILLFALLAGTVRLRVVGHAEPEFSSTAFGELADATIGRIFDTTPVHKRKPMEQLQFWQPRIDKILAEHPHDAELHAAAALIYDKPANGMSESASKIVLESEINAWDFGSAVITTIRNWITPYDHTATPLAMELASRAVQLDPQNPQWLQLQAAISAQPLLYPEDSVLRSDLLNEAAEKAQTVNPDNGIYDLLLAENMITGSMQFDERLRGRRHWPRTH